VQNVSAGRKNVLICKIDHSPGLHSQSTAPGYLLGSISDGKFGHESRDADQPYIPPTKPYELSSLAVDLVLLARYLLKPSGRLVFFLPTVTEEYAELDVQVRLTRNESLTKHLILMGYRQSMLCEGMEVIANSLQDFGSWGRRVSIPTTLPPISRLNDLCSLSPSRRPHRKASRLRRSTPPKRSCPTTS
jgi:hypothetical protein